MSDRRVAYNISQVFARRDRLVKVIAEELKDGRTADTIAVAAAAVFRFLKGTAPYAAVYATVCRLTDPAVTTSDVAWSVAGGLRELRAGRPVTKGVFPPGSVWVPVEVEAARLGTRRNDERVFLRVRVLAGPGCPATLSVDWSPRAARYYATHDRGLGLSESQALRYAQPRELYGCRFNARVAAEKDRPKVVQVVGSPSMTAHNRDLMRRRRLRQVHPCPRGYTHACATCPVGRVACPAATHAENWVVITCQSCKAERFADTRWGVSVCVQCFAKRGDVL